MISLDIYSYYNQYEVALAVILCSRSMVGIKNEWHPTYRTPVIDLVMIPCVP